LAASLDDIIVSVCRNYPWASPIYVGEMFYDEKDHNGLIYWYNDIEKQHKAIEALNKTK
jgi:hypothetical protein